MSATEKLEVIVGADGVKRLAEATVMVLGCGGVGSNCAVALARGGVGNLVLVDRDVVSESNINRQAVAFYSTIGRNKVDVMRDIALDINPQIQVETHVRFLTEEDVPEFLESYRERVDWFVDAIDTVSTKLALAEYADKTELPLVSSMGGGNKLDPELFTFADIYDTKGCPLCRVMRREARKRGVGHLQVLYSSEVPVETEAQPDAERSDRSDLGTMSYIPPIMGQMLAGWVIRKIVGL